MNRFFGKRDAILIASVLAVAFAVFGIMSLTGKNGVKAVIYVDNKEIKTLPLDEDAAFTVENEYGKNVVRTENGEVYVTDADCRDKICVNTGRKSKAGEIIVCLPHRLVVQVEE